MKNFKKMLKGRKAILMTITALLISALFFVVFNKENIMPAFYTDQPVKTRVMVMDGYVQSIPVIIGDSLEIATYDALNSLYRHYSAAGTFPTEQQFRNELYSCIRCGHIGGCSSFFPVCSEMNGTDILNASSRVIALADTHLNLPTTILITDFNITQNYPYDVDVRLEVEYSVSDSSFGVSWRKRENITRIVSIIGLNDPLAGINTARGYEKTVLRSAICEFNDTCWNYNKTDAFYREQKFTYAINGTSFLSRYWNSTSPSRCCGIESFMKIDDYRNVSFLDHYYFSGQYYCTAAIVPAEKTILAYPLIDTNFKLDSETAGRYGMSDNGTLMCRP